MRGRLLLGVFATLLLGTAPVFAQDASLVGTVTDETKAVLPGVTVTATNLDTGAASARRHRRARRVPPAEAAAGKYKLQAELSGFGGVVVPTVELLVGQNAAVPFTMKVAAVSEDVTVTGEAPLVDISSSQVAGNVDRRQMEELPLQGRNWMELSMMVKGITANDASATSPASATTTSSSSTSTASRSRRSSPARASASRSSAARRSPSSRSSRTCSTSRRAARPASRCRRSRSRAPTPTSGSLYGFFRNDAFNAADPVAQRRCCRTPNQQVGGTLGGPIVKDKMHYFASYEYERAAGHDLHRARRAAGQTFTFPYEDHAEEPARARRRQLSSKDRCRSADRAGTGTTRSTSAAAAIRRRPTCSTGTRRTSSAPGRSVISGNTVQQVRVGYDDFFFGQTPLRLGGRHAGIRLPGPHDRRAVQPAERRVAAELRGRATT